MEYILENNMLAVTVSTHGAEIVSAVSKSTGAQMIWGADPAVWGRHAPVLFPYVGKLKNGQYTLDGNSYSGGGHGFARDMEFEALETGPDRLVFLLNWSEETLQKFPRKFALKISYTLDGKTLRQETEVSNLDERALRFGLGYHPAFRIPFDSKHATEDYEIRFDSPQNADEAVFEKGLITDRVRPYLRNQAAIPMNDRMFDNDSVFMKGLSSKTISLTEKDTGRSISVELQGFPYCLIWSALNQEKLQFLCLEPWHTHPDLSDADGDWNHKACAAELKSGEHWTSHLNITFNR